MKLVRAPRQQRKVTFQNVKIGDREIKIMFLLDGVHLREKHSRTPIVVPYERLAKSILATHLKLTDPAAIELAVTSGNLQLFAEMVQNGSAERLALMEVEEQLKLSLKMVKAKLLLA